MESRSLRVLEFDKIRARLAAFAQSDLGRERCMALVPVSSAPQAALFQEETEEAVVLYTRAGGSPIPSFDDIRPALGRARIGATLSARELLVCASCMRAARSVRSALTDSETTPRICGMANLLTPMRPIEERIASAILSEDEIADNASPELASIRRHMRLCAERIRERLNQMVRSTTFQKYLMEPIITIRSDRFVLPVKQEHRQSVPGLVHDQSASGATLFIEPMAVVEINNDLKDWALKERDEIERILREITAEIAPVCGELEQNLDVLAHMDFLFAKAALSREMRATQPVIDPDLCIRIIKGRHPLLNPDTVVPIDLWLGREFTTLVITGPNTGGKTVTLKTVGLFCLMAAAGLQVPADLGTRLPIFDEVFADIGDEQSIEQSLSTFSSHMTNIVRILTNMTERSLVLFDELGAGTDPTEGAALAMSILDELQKRRIRAMATTHYSELKAYALTHDGVENASVEFNVETLRPTYRLSIGVPGKSNAFEIAKRLGLPDALIEDARTRLSKEQIRFEDVIQSAEYHRQVAERERQLAEEASLEMTRLRDEADALQKQIQQQRQTMMQKAKEDARRVVRQAQAQAEEVIAQLRKAQKDEANLSKAVLSARHTLSDALDANSEGMTDRRTAPIRAPQTVKPGDEVNLVSMGVTATVLGKPDAKGEVQVQAGIMKMMVPLSQMELVEAKKSAYSQAKRGIDMAARSVTLELDVRGESLGEAIADVDRYLDDVVLAGLSEVSLIHGKGTGTLRTGIQAHLKRNPHVESFRDGKFGEGESGVTVVKLK